MKVRKTRWERRESLKERSNRMNALDAQHPQVYREMQHHDQEIDEALRWQVEVYLPTLRLSGRDRNPDAENHV